MDWRRPLACSHVSLSLSLSLSLGSLAANAPAQAQLIQTLVSAYTPGEQLSLELTPDGTRGFLAEGATIVVLNMTVAPPVELARHQVPDCQPLAMRYWHASGGEHYLFIAGGSLGVWRLTLCPGLLGSPPELCPAEEWGDLLVQAPIEHGYFERKRCVDVEILETSNGPVLFALFSASSLTVESGVGGPTELRAYTWTGAGATHVGARTFPSTDPQPPNPSPPTQVGTALAVDPNDHDSIYVGMGKGGIWRGDISFGGSSWSLAAPVIVWAPGCGTCPSCPGTYPVQHVRDLAIVRVTSPTPKSVLYAALNYNEILEIEDLGGAGMCTRLPLGSSSAGIPNGYAERIAAIVEGGSNVLVAVGAQGSAGKYEDSFAPRNVNGCWTSICIYPGLADPNDPHVPSPMGQLQLYTHDFAPGGGGLTYRSRKGYTEGPGWNTAILQPGVSGSTKRLTLTSTYAGTEVLDVDPATGVATQVGAPFVQGAFGGQDSIVSTLNSGVVQFVSEAFAATEPSPQVAYIDPLSPYTITPVAKTQWSPCANDSTQPVCADTVDLGMYAAGLFGGAQWVDSGNPARQFVVVGRRLLENVNYLCNPIQGCFDPCMSGHPFSQYRKWDSDGDPNNGRQAKNGWRVTNLLIPPQGQPPLDGPALDPRWVQIDLPLAPGEVSEMTNDRVDSVADPRKTNGVPNAVYLARGGKSHMFALRASDIEAAAASACQPYGNGEQISTTASPLAHHATRIHVELEPNGLGATSPPHYDGHCNTIAPCPLGPGYGPHHLANGHSVVYRTTDLSGSAMYVWACAAGFIATGHNENPPPSPLPLNFVFQSMDCQWKSLAGRPMLSLIDITRTGDGTFQAPQLLRVGLGMPDGVQGHAFSIAVKSAGAARYAYVGDLLGRIWVFKVDGQEILPAPPVQSNPPSLEYTYLQSTPILDPVSVLELPSDPFDGVKANCIDLEIVGPYLYCALGRIGVGIVSISNPSNPQLIAVMDTPGLALGLSTRTVTVGGVPFVQLIVGDSRCGPRVYQ